MANTVLGNCIVVNSANQFLMPTTTAANLGGGAIKLKGILLAMTTTDALLQLGINDSAGTSVLFQLDKYTTFLQFDGLQTQNLIVTTISNGTGFLYLG